MVYLTAAAVSALVAVSSVNALPMPPPGSCVVDLNGSGYSSLAIRPTPCNNQPALVYLTNGQVVQSLNQQKSGCDFKYNKVKYTDSDGNVYSGWAGADWLICNNSPTSGTVNTPKTMATSTRAERALPGAPFTTAPPPEP